MFKWAIKNFTKKPHGGVIQVSVQSADHDKEITISHHDLYEATAIPVIATSIQLLGIKNKKGGKLFMGEFVKVKPFLKIIEDIGMQVQESIK